MMKTSVSRRFLPLLKCGDSFRKLVVQAREMCNSKLTKAQAENLNLSVREKHKAPYKQTFSAKYDTTEIINWLISCSSLP